MDGFQRVGFGGLSVFGHVTQGLQGFDDVCFVGG